MVVAVDTHYWTDRLAAVERNGELLPMLWSESSPQADLLTMLPHYTLVPGGLHVSLATVATSPDGRIGISHLTHHQLGPDGAWGEVGSFEELFETARENLKSGLRIEEYDNGVLVMHREGGIAESAVCLPDFHSYVSDLVGEERFVVGLPCPQHVVIAAESSPHAQTVHSMTMDSDYPPSESLPSVLRVDRRGITILAERR
jgi:hypothetical protein